MSEYYEKLQVRWRAATESNRCVAFSFPVVFLLFYFTVLELCMKLGWWKQRLNQNGDIAGRKTRAMSLNAKTFSEQQNRVIIFCEFINISDTFHMRHYFIHCSLNMKWKQAEDATRSEGERAACKNTKLEQDFNSEQRQKKKINRKWVEKCSQRTHRERQKRRMFEIQGRESKLQSLSQPLVKAFHNSGGSHPAFSSVPPITQTWKLAEGNSLHFHCSR